MMLDVGANMEEQYETAPDRELTWTEKFKLVEAELKKDPARSDGLISRTLGNVSKASVYRIREVLVADGVVKHIPIEGRTGVNGGKIRLNGVDYHRLNSGNRIQVPPGKTVVDLVRVAMQEEANGMLTPDAARLIGIGDKSLREARALVLLSDKDGMDASEKVLIDEAIEEMNRTRRTTLPYKKVLSLVNKVWGENTPKDKRSADKRHQAFKHAMTIVVDACIAAASINVPHLTNEERVAVIKQIEEAASGIRRLKSRIIVGRWK